MDTHRVDFFFSIGPGTAHLPSTLLPERLFQLGPALLHKNILHHVHHRSQQYDADHDRDPPFNRIEPDPRAGEPNQCNQEDHIDLNH